MSFSVMFCSKQSNNSISKLQERSLWIINDDQKNNSHDLISEYEEYNINQRNLQTFIIEIYKIIVNIGPQIMNFLFLFDENVHNIRNFKNLPNSSKKTVRYGLETVSQRSSFLWANLTQDCKSQASLRFIQML